MDTVLRRAFLDHSINKLRQYTDRIENASISVIEKRNGRFVVSGVNDTSHLEAAQ